MGFKSAFKGSNILYQVARVFGRSVV